MNQGMSLILKKRMKMAPGMWSNPNPISQNYEKESYLGHIYCSTKLNVSFLFSLWLQPLILVTISQAL